MTQLYIHSFSFRFFSHIGYYRALSRVPCAQQQVHVDYLFLYIGVCLYPKLLIYGSSHHVFPSVTVSLFLKSVNLFLICN